MASKATSRASKKQRFVWQTLAKGYDGKAGQEGMESKQTSLAKRLYCERRPQQLAQIPWLKGENFVFRVVSFEKTATIWMAQKAKGFVLCQQGRDMPQQMSQKPQGFVLCQEEHATIVCIKELPEKLFFMWLVFWNMGVLEEQLTKDCPTAIWADQRKGWERFQSREAACIFSEAASVKETSFEVEDRLFGKGG